MRNGKGNRHNQVVETCIDGVGDWSWISTEVRSSAIGCSEGVELSCDSIYHEEDGIIDPGIYFVKVSSEGDGIMRYEVGPASGNLVGTAGIPHEDVVAFINAALPPTMRCPEQAENFIKGSEAPVGFQYVKISLSVNSSVKNSLVIV